MRFLRRRAEFSNQSDPVCLKVLGLATGLTLLCSAINGSAAHAQSVLWKTLFDSGKQAVANGDLAQAEKQFEAALNNLSQSEELKGAAAAQVPITMKSLAEVLVQEGKFERAEELYQAAIEADEKLTGPASDHVAEDLIQLAHSYRKQEKFSQAEPLYKKAIEIYIKAGGAESAKVGSGLCYLALLCVDQSQYQTAESIFNRAAEILRKSAPNSESLAVCLTEYGILFALENKSAAAEPLYKEALKIRESAAGPNSLAVAKSLDNLGKFYADLADEKCQDFFKRAEAIERSLSKQSASSAADTELASTLTDHADFLVADSRFDDAQPLYEESVRLFEHSFGNRSTHV
ncbi:MAG TPA: tetratricopeptide repeat protein, partial [Chroococcales cyanobacterium]